LSAGAAKDPTSANAAWLAEKKLTTEVSLKVVVQVRDNRVWVGTFYGTGDSTDHPGTYETFPRPDGKTHQECVSRALGKALKWIPTDFSQAGQVASDW